MIALAVGSALVALLAAVAGFCFGPSTLLVWHVPAAVFSYLFFLGCVLINLGRALNRDWRFSLAKASCDFGLGFAGITLVSGMIWAHQAWGTAWVWEPRLTGMFLTTILFLSWRLSSHYIEKFVAASRVATSALIVLALPAIAFTHLATRLFGGIHPTSMPHEDAFSPLAWVAAPLCYLSAVLFVVSLHLYIEKRQIKP